MMDILCSDCWNNTEKKSIKNWRDKNGSKTNSKKEKVVC